jgi:hypothetical protein
MVSRSGGEKPVDSETKDKLKVALVIITYIFWPVVILVGLYLPFVRSPEMTEAQLLINYWWFYVPVVIGVGVLSVLHQKARRRG